MYSRDGADTPINLNKCNGSELSNTVAISPFRNITCIWPTSVSRHDNTLKGGKVHCYNYIHEIAKTPISSTSSSSVNRPISQMVQVFPFILA